MIMANSNVLQLINTWKGNFCVKKHPDLKPVESLGAENSSTRTLAKYDIMLFSKDDDKHQVFVCLSSNTCTLPNRSGELCRRQFKIYVSFTGSVVDTKTLKENRNERVRQGVAMPPRRHNSLPKQQPTKNEIIDFISKR